MTRRPGFTLLELVVVMAVLVVLGAVVVPSLSGVNRDTNIKAAADIVKARIADARGKAIEDGQAYRLAVSADGARIRIAPDLADANMLGETNEGAGFLVAEDEFPKGVTGEVVLDSASGDAAAQDDAGWRRVATFLPDGTCKEDVVELALREPNVYTLIVRVRGLTGAVSLVKAPAGAGGQLP